MCRLKYIACRLFREYENISILADPKLYVLTG